MRVVLDTNVVVSALLFSGETARVHDLWIGGAFAPLISKQVLEEYVRVLSYPKFRLEPDEVDYLIKMEFLLYSEPIEVTKNLDNKFLSLASDGKADYLVSSDGHLLDLENWRQGRIVSVREFLTLIQN